MKPIFSQLRRDEISCTYYIDDSLYLDNSYEKLETHTQRAIALLYLFVESVVFELP